MSIVDEGKVKDAVKLLVESRSSIAETVCLISYTDLEIRQMLGKKLALLTWRLDKS